MADTSQDSLRVRSCFPSTLSISLTAVKGLGLNPVLENCGGHLGHRRETRELSVTQYVTEYILRARSV